MTSPESVPSVPIQRARPHKRRTENLIIVAVLSFEIMAPLSYYLGTRGYDERFSWRMFSTLRLRDCKVRVIETPRGGGAPHDVAIEQDVQLGWLRLLERMRDAVVDRYLERRCERAEAELVEFVCTCSDTDGRELPPTRRSLHCDADKQEAP